MSVCKVIPYCLRRIASMEKVREELICAVCLDFLREPKGLNCAHAFCTQCLSGIVSTQKGVRQSAAVRPVDLECPSCRHVTVLKTGRVELDLSTNHNLKRLVEIVSEEEKIRTLKVCSYCKHYVISSIILSCSAQAAEGECVPVYKQHAGCSTLSTFLWLQRSKPLISPRSAVQ